MPGRKDISIVEIVYIQEQVPMNYKFHINNYLTSSSNKRIQKQNENKNSQESNSSIFDGINKKDGIVKKTTEVAENIAEKVSEKVEKVSEIVNKKIEKVYEKVKEIKTEKDNKKTEEK